MSDLCDPIDSSPPDFTVLEVLQAITLEWVAISFSNAWKWDVKVKSVSHVRLLATPWTAAYKAPLPMGFSRQEYWSGFHCLLQNMLKFIPKKCLKENVCKFTETWNTFTTPLPFTTKYSMRFFERTLKACMLYVCNNSLNAIRHNQLKHNGRFWCLPKEKSHATIYGFDLHISKFQFKTEKQ